MKKFLILLAGIVFVVACNNDDDNGPAGTDASVVGEWTLTEILADPGDGSGTFQPVVSSKSLTFSATGEVTSSGNICSMFIVGNEPTSGLYSEEDHSITATCGITYPITYEIDAEDNLILSHPCIEACQEKYVRIIKDF